MYELQGTDRCKENGRALDIARVDETSRAKASRLGNLKKERCFSADLVPLLQLQMKGIA